MTPKVKYSLIVIYSCFVCFIILDILFPVNTYINYSKMVYDRNGKVISMNLNKEDKWRFEVEVDEVSEYFTNTILSKEDKYFYYHFGFNPISIIQALFLNIRNGKIVSGASTITMQLARMLEPKERTYLNKIKEIFRAIQLETHFSKNEILKMYLNLLPFGGNLEGIQSVSHFYLNKDCSKLSLGESLVLANIPQNPNKYRLDKIKDLQDVKDELYKILLEEEFYSKEEIEIARSEKFQFKRVNATKNAPQFSNRMIYSENSSTNIKTTIDLSLQLRVERTLKEYQKEIKRSRVYNSAAIIIDNRNGEVLCYVGSGDFNDTLHAGQIDGVQAIRSPGSTLKPLIYLLAVQKGLITPKSKLPDFMIDIDLYSPKNFDDNYNGLVSTEDALRRSLNIPAVYLLDKIGINEFLVQMERLGFETQQIKENPYGLSLALGAFGTDLETLSKFYLNLATGGLDKNLVYLKNEAKLECDTIFDERSVSIIRDVLKENSAPDFSAFTDYLPIRSDIAWKTGTSYNRKDLWSIGFSDRFTVGVWTGNFQNEETGDNSGSKISTPLLFKIFSILDNKYGQSKFRDYELPRRDLCSVTGKVPGEYCNELISDIYLPFYSSTEICDHIITAHVSIDEKTLYCVECLPDSNYKEKLIYKFDPNVFAYLNERNVNTTDHPEHEITCKRVKSGFKPKITSPSNSIEYVLSKSDSLVFTSNASADIKNINWFINGKLVGHAPKEQKFIYRPEKKGKLEIMCMDDQGRSSTIFIRLLSTE